MDIYVLVKIAYDVEIKEKDNEKIVKKVVIKNVEVVNLVKVKKVEKVDNCVYDFIEEIVAVNKLVFIINLKTYDFQIQN